MDTTTRRENFLHGMASVFDLFPAPAPVRRRTIGPRLTAEEQALADQLFDPQYAAWNRLPDTANQEVAGLLALAEALAADPRLVAAEPDAVDWVAERAEQYARQPVRFGRVSRVGHLWVDKVKLAADRRRVRVRMLDRIRGLIAVARAHRAIPASGNGS